MCQGRVSGGAAKGMLNPSRGRSPFVREMAGVACKGEGAEHGAKVGESSSRRRFACCQRVKQSRFILIIPSVTAVPVRSDVALCDESAVGYATNKLAIGEFGWGL